MVVIAAEQAPEIHELISKFLTVTRAATGFLKHCYHVDTGISIMQDASLSVLTERGMADAIREYVDKQETGAITRYSPVGLIPCVFYDCNSALHCVLGCSFIDASLKSTIKDLFENDRGVASKVGISFSVRSHQSLTTCDPLLFVYHDPLRMTWRPPSSLTRSDSACWSVRTQVLLIHLGCTSSRWLVLTVCSCAAMLCQS